MEINFNKHAWEKINAYIKHTEGEIQGLGQATLDKETQIITITDVFIWKQKCSGASTEAVDQQAVFDLVEELEKRGVPMEDLCVWWHSHADMDAFFSSTDVNTINRWPNNKFLVSVVGNKKGKFEGRVDMKESVYCMLKGEITHTEIIDEALEKTIEKEIDEKITKEVGFFAKEEEGRQKWQVTEGDHHGQNNNWEEWENGPDLAIMNSEEKRQLYLESAETCGCKKCQGYLARKNKFPRLNHVWDPYYRTLVIDINSEEVNDDDDNDDLPDPRQGKII